MPSRDDVVREARSWLGTPWVHQHSERGIATDCAGLVVGVARRLGLVDEGFRLHGYTRAPDGSMTSICDQHMQRIGRDEMAPGDVVVMRVDKLPQHLGIVAPYIHGGLAIIHASNTGTKRVVEHRLMFGPRLRFVAAYRLPGVA